MNETQYLLEMRGIGKTFPGVRALEDVDFRVRPGEVHALVGENGAGKSTLIKIITGVYPLESGQMLLDGSPVRPLSPRHAQHLGISAIHQEVDLLPYLSVAENIYIGRQPRKFMRIDWRTLNSRAQTAMRRLGIDIDVTQPLGSCSVAIRQMVSIARAVDMSCRILVMDEPTSSLDEGEVGQLFEVIRKLKASGTAVIFITHFLDQLYEISDRITVLRNGQQVGVYETGSLPKLDLVAHMLGRSREDAAQLLDARPPQSNTESGEVFLEAKNLQRTPALRPFNLTIRRGEVVGLAGLLGSGRTEIARLLFGIDKPNGGCLSIDGHPTRELTPAEAVRRGIGFSPEDRRTEGIIPDLSVRENIVLAIHKQISRMGITSRRAQESIARQFVKALNISTPSLDQPVKFLSGGNQQKVILARWLASRPTLLILDEPTRGIDVGAKAEVESLIESLKNEGKAILFISSELDEVLRRSSRIVVMRDRKMVAELSGKEAGEQQVMRAIAGGVPGEED